MSLAAPWALLGWTALPLLWWLHRRLRRPPDVALPSLIFLQDEEEARALPRGRVLDAELFLALTAAALLTLAAAGPHIVRTPAHREVQVIVSGGTPAAMRGYAQRVESVLANVRAGLASDDVLRVRHEPAPPQRDELVPRPTEDALLAAARAGRQALSVVISDLPAPAETGDVHWVSVGEPGATNVGIVAASVGADGDRTSVFFTVANHGDAARDVHVFTAAQRGSAGETRQGGLTRLVVPRRGAASGTFSLEGQPERISVSLGDAAGVDLEDDLRADDTIVFTRAPLRVYLHPELPAHLPSIRAALGASLGRGGFQELAREDASQAQLAFVPVWAPLPGEAWLLTLQPTASGDPLTHAPPGANPLGRDPLVRDLSGAGVDWVYAPGAAERASNEEVLLHRVAERPWPLVLRSGRRIRLAPDPLRGDPPAVQTPFWPLLIENLVRRAGGAAGGDAGAGYRVTGLLDPASTQPGRARSAFEPARLAAVAPSVPAVASPLMGSCILGALVCLALLWGAPRLRRRLARGRRQGEPVAAG